MAKESKSQKTAKRNRFLYKAALAIISTIIIVWFMPHNSSSQYSYEVGAPWNYGQLIAKFKFPIYKSDAEMKNDRDSVMKDFKPYYKLNRNVRNKKHNDLYTKNIDDWDGPNSLSYINHINVLLDSIYRLGVLSVDDYNKLIEEGYSHVRILDNNTSITIAVSQLYSTKTAYSKIMDSDTIKYPRVNMQKFNITDLIAPNLTYDVAKTEAERNEILDNLPGADGIVQSGEQIIDRGEIVSPLKYKILKSLERELAKNKDTESPIPYSIIGQTIFVLFLMVTLVTYLTLFRDDYFDNYRSGLLLFGFPVAFCVVAFLMVTHNFLNVFMIPCCMVPIVIRIFMDSRTAFMFHTAMVIIISLTLHYSYVFVILQMVTGMIAIQTLRELSQRSQIIQTAALIAITYIVFYTSTQLIFENSFDKADYSMYEYFIINGILLLFTYPLLWFIEKSLGMISDVTLVELSNINHPILQRMSEIAPGTFQHSMQVANLSSEVAKKIKARSQLVRTGALYHDIGKLERPVFFTENQKGVSPHKHLSAQKSAEVIIAHIANGIALAEKYNLPKSIKDFIQTHHGVGMTKYFYVTYKNEHPDEVINDNDFRYPGPNPSSKEQAILMMADAVEAASRSLSEYTEDSISQLVDRIIDSQVQEGYFSECDITFRDIATAKSVFKEKLKIVYHTRISYPELNKDAAKQSEQKEA